MTKTPRTWWVSDTHFSHRNIIKYCDRPFGDPGARARGDVTDAAVREMDETMARNWNARVAPEDTVYHLGDFAIGSDRRAMSELLDGLNGTKHLIQGNHDHKQTRRLPGWASVSPYQEIRVGERFIVMCHYAMRVWNKSHHGSLMLYGHSHATLPGNSQSLDVGVDEWDYRPVGLDEILDRMATLPRYTGYADQAGGGDHHNDRAEKQHAALAGA